MEVTELVLERLELERLKEGLYEGFCDIHNQIGALEHRVKKLEEVKMDIQKHVMALERRVQILEKEAKGSK